MTRENKPGLEAVPRVLAEPVSELTTNRLSVYLRCLNALDASGVRTISSQALAEQFHLNAAQIRKDLAHFGEFGVRGIGYYVKELRRPPARDPRLDRGVRVAINGGRQPRARAGGLRGFRDDGFEIVALFDTLKERSAGARAVGPHPRHQEFQEGRQREAIGIAVIAVPASRAERGNTVSARVESHPQLFTRRVRVPRGVKLKNMDLTVSLEGLSFFLAQRRS